MTNRHGFYYMKKIFMIGVLCVVGLFTTTVYAEDIALFTFTTEPQTIDVDAVSKEIILQSQNASGTAQPIPETFDLVFNSSSATGLFQNSSGNAVSTTMSKNTANRTFYYKDPTAGDFVLTVTATGRESKKVFTATQHIYVGVQNPDPQATATTTATTTPETINETQTKIIYIYSAHSSPAPLSITEPKMEFEISAGRDRLATVGTSMLFRASATKTVNVSDKNITYTWSFGDGTTGTGDTVYHVYRFAGNYSVVLNGTFSDKQAASRTLVRVVDPHLQLTRVSGGLEISNKSDAEINLESWSLVSSEKTFFIPKDTLIMAQSTNVFADDVTGIYTNSVSLHNGLGKVYASAGDLNNVLAVDVPTSTPLVTIAENVDTLKKQIAQISKSLPIQQIVTTSVKENKIKIEQKIQPATSSPSEIYPSTQLANAAVVFESPQTQGVVSRMFSWPSVGFHFIKRLFIEE